MRSLSSSNKAQFFVLSAVAIITILFLLSKLFEPTNIIDTSAVVLNEAPFIFENVKEKAPTAINGSKNCFEARYNLEEFKRFAEDYGLGKGYRLLLNYNATSCPAPAFSANISQDLTVSGTFINSKYSLACNSFPCLV